MFGGVPHPCLLCCSSVEVSSLVILFVGVTLDRLLSLCYICVTFVYCVVCSLCYLFSYFGDCHYVPLSCVFTGDCRLYVLLWCLAESLLVLPLVTVVHFARVCWLLSFLYCLLLDSELTVYCFR